MGLFSYAHIIFTVTCGILLHFMNVNVTADMKPCVPRHFDEVSRDLIHHVQITVWF